MWQRGYASLFALGFCLDSTCYRMARVVDPDAYEHVAN